MDIGSELSEALYEALMKGEISLGDIKQADLATVVPMFMVGDRYFDSYENAVRYLLGEVKK